MWINGSMWAMQQAEVMALRDELTKVSGVVGENTRLLVENARLRSDMDWFKLRLNQVELERAQLIMAASGVKISTPAFVPAQEDPMRALQEMPDFAQVGEDMPDAESTPDYSGMPRRANN